MLCARGGMRFGEGFTNYYKVAIFLEGKRKR
jgi:hypothetical protein